MQPDEWGEKAREITGPHVICGDGIFSPNTTINAVKAFEAQIAAALREAYQRGRNEAGHERAEGERVAERRGIERAAKWHDRNAEACKTLIAEGFEVEANAREYAFHKNAADHLRAVAQRMAGAGPTEPAGESDREGT